MCFEMWTRNFQKNAVESDLATDRFIEIQINEQ